MHTPPINNPPFSPMVALNDIRGHVEDMLFIARGIAFGQFDDVDAAVARVDAAYMTALLYVRSMEFHHSNASSPPPTAAAPNPDHH